MSFRTQQAGSGPRCRTSEHTDATDTDGHQRTPRTPEQQNCVTDITTRLVCRIPGHGPRTSPRHHHPTRRAADPEWHRQCGPSTLWNHTQPHIGGASTGSVGAHHEVGHASTWPPTYRRESVTQNDDSIARSVRPLGGVCCLFDGDRCPAMGLGRARLF